MSYLGEIRKALKEQNKQENGRKLTVGMLEQAYIKDNPKCELCPNYMDEVLIKAILETQENQQTILKALSKILDDIEEIKAGISSLNGKSND